MSDWKDQLSQMVYSTDQGRISPEPEAEEVPEGDGIVRLRRETKGRGKVSHRRWLSFTAE